MLDGMIARKYHLITSFGKFVDPIADKLLVNTVLNHVGLHTSSEYYSGSIDDCT